MSKVTIIIVLLIVFSPVMGYGKMGERNNNYYTNRPPLVQKSFIQLPLVAIKPRGWLYKQCRLAADGMTGHLDTLYPEVMGPRNGWLGGDGDGWERGPYWIDGLVPLAYILDDKELIKKAKKWIEWSLKSLKPSGYFGPEPFEEKPEPEPGLQKTNREDWWPHMIMLKALQSYFSATGDERVIELMTKYFHYQLKTLPEKPLDHWTIWAKTRGGENLSSIYWLYNRTGDKFLLDLAQILHKQTTPWIDLFLNGDLIIKSNSLWKSEWFCIHGVNLAMAIKEPTIYYQQAKEEKYLKASKKAFQDLNEFHGQPQGMFGNDELLHGTGATQGTELCTVVEFMFSLENLIQITGDIEYADHLEKVAYNALPTHIKDDFSTRQYYQLPNQIIINRTNRNFITPHFGTDICYGLLTGYPCCTCNLHQGWPKFVRNLWYATSDSGAAALVYAPSEVSMKVGDEVKVH
jgi:hypothetical protein